MTIEDLDSVTAHVAQGPVPTSSVRGFAPAPSTSSLGIIAEAPAGGGISDSSGANGVLSFSTTVSLPEAVTDSTDCYTNVPYELTRPHRFSEAITSSGPIVLPLWNGTFRRSVNAYVNPPLLTS